MSYLLNTSEAMQACAQDAPRVSELKFTRQATDTMDAQAMYARLATVAARFDDYFDYPEGDEVKPTPCKLNHDVNSVSLRCRLKPMTPTQLQAVNAEINAYIDAKLKQDERGAGRGRS